MKSIDSRLSALEAASKSDTAGQLPYLILRGPNEEAELAQARASGRAAELDTDENNAKYLG